VEAEWWLQQQRLGAEDAAGWSSRGTACHASAVRACDGRSLDRDATFAGWAAMGRRDSAGAHQYVRECRKHYSLHAGHAGARLLTLSAWCERFAALSASLHTAQHRQHVSANGTQGGVRQTNVHVDACD
jgi:hypothetical protein